VNYIKINKCDVANGQGVRVVLWLSGCSLHCENCHNPETWDRNYGYLFDDNVKKELFDALSKPYIKGITFSGGHPLEEYNLSDLYSLITEIKSTFNDDKDIWLYTGLIFEDLIKDNRRYNIIKNCDVIIDGPFINKLKDLSLKWRGSSNQRIIDVKKSLENNKIILFSD
jgi:anaerobic ribonucleoside-triphosphate reductase activating protein